MNNEKLAKLPDWPALMDSPTAVLYLGGSEDALADLEAKGLLTRWSSGHKNVRYLRVHIDAALVANTMLKKSKSPQSTGKKTSDVPVIS